VRIVDDQHPDAFETNTIIEPQSRTRHVLPPWSVRIEIEVYGRRQGESGQDCSRARRASTGVRLAARYDASPRTSSPSAPHEPLDLSVEGTAATPFSGSQSQRLRGGADDGHARGRRAAESAPTRRVDDRARIEIHGSLVRRHRPAADEASPHGHGGPARSLAFTRPPARASARRSTSRVASS
jgi:hypothetical protein